MEERDMNADERTPGQQGYGEQTPQQGQDQTQPTGQQRQPGQGPQGNMAEQGQGGSASTGQASYGNSGETGTDTLSQNSSSLGQDSDLGQSNQASQSNQGSNSGLFGGPSSDMGSGSAGTGRTGIEGSLDGPNQSESDMGGSTGRSGIEGSLDETGEQDFADQGQGALSEDAMGSSQNRGTTDIETERSQGRETDIEGSSL